MVGYYGLSLRPSCQRPLRHIRQQQPHGAPEGAGQMSQPGIHGDDQIHALGRKRCGAKIIKKQREIGGERYLTERLGCGVLLHIE